MEEVACVFWEEEGTVLSVRNILNWRCCEISGQLDICFRSLGARFGLMVQILESLGGSSDHNRAFTKREYTE